MVINAFEAAEMVIKVGWEMVIGGVLEAAIIVRLKSFRWREGVRVERRRVRVGWMVPIARFLISPVGKRAGGHHEGIFFIQLALLLVLLVVHLDPLVDLVTRAVSTTLFPLYILVILSRYLASLFLIGIVAGLSGPYSAKLSF
jgi:hypothetical protein